MAVLQGTPGDDVLTGGPGNDTLVGRGGADRMNGNAGIDTARYDDSLTGVTVDLSTGQGHGGDAEGDLLSEIENLIGSRHDDILSARFPGLGPHPLGSWLQGGDGADTLTGNIGRDTLDGGNGADTLRGGAENDTLIGRAGADVLDGGLDTDLARYDDSGAAVTVDLSTGLGHRGDAEGDTLTAIENLIGSRFDDILTGDGGRNSFDGGAGNDTLDGGAGDDHMGGSAGDDDLQGGAGDDELNGGAGDDTLTGGAGNDLLAGLAGADVLDGGDGLGLDFANYAGSGAGVTVDLSAGRGHGGDAEGDILRHVEAVTGSAFDDVLTGDDAINILAGGAGNDTLIGGNGDDHLDGGDGDDLLRPGLGINPARGGRGNDTVSYDGLTVGVRIDLEGSFSVENGIGGAGNDWIVSTNRGHSNHMSGGDGDDVLIGRGGGDLLDGGNGIDMVRYDDGAAVTIDLSSGQAHGGAEGDVFVSIESIIGSNLADILTGDDGANTLSGAGGADTLSGGGGNDHLNGSYGNDVLNGGAGADTLAGQPGADTLAGGLGSDTFFYGVESDSTVAVGSRDTITDFSHAQGDRIDLSVIDADRTQPGNEAFTFIGNAAFSGTAGELRWSVQGTAVLVEGDVNGDGTADLAILLQQLSQVQGSDFVL